MITTEQEQVLKMIIEIDKGLTGASLTFAVDNLADSMDKPEWDVFIGILYTLIKKGFLAKHTAKETNNRVPYWLELTKKGKEYFNTD